MPAVALAALLSVTPSVDARWARVVAALQLVAEEYFEALELNDKAAMRRRHEALGELLDRTAPLVPAPAVRAEVRALRARLATVDYKLGDDTRALIGRILARVKLRRTPQARPELDRGRQLYAQACAACHGAGATGESAIAATMDPPPGNILHPEYNWSPWDMFNRITYGGAQTAMPAFDEGLSEAQRWDIVFWLFAERWPPCTKPLPPLGADELALLGDFELGNKFGYGAASCLRREYLPPGSGGEAGAAAAVSLLTVLQGDAEAESASPERARQERQEQIDAAAALVSELEPLQGPELEAARALEKAAGSTETAGRVRALAIALQRKLVRRFALELRPSRAPDLRRGAALYQQSCAACHGKDGTPGALELSTAPVALADPAATRTFSPRRIYDAATAGVPGTAMPSFADGLSDRDRWDIAFYARALAHPHAGALPKAVRVDYRQAAIAGDDFLAVQLESAGLERGEIESAVAAIRRSPRAAGGDRPAPLVIPRWLFPARIASEAIGDGPSVRVDLILARPVSQSRNALLSMVRLVARQIFLRGGTPPADLTLSAWASEEAKRAGAAPVAACHLVSEEYFDCGVAPAEAR